MPAPEEAFVGFQRPTYTMVPDELFDVLLPDLSGAELKVLLYIIRRTFGFKRDSDCISLSQMLNGITTKEGRVLDRGAGLSKPTLLQALRSLQDRNIIEAERQSSREKGNEPTLYRLKFASSGDIEGGKNIIPPLDKKLDQGLDQETLPSPWPKNFTKQQTDKQQTVEQESSNIRKANRETNRENPHTTTATPETGFSPTAGRGERVQQVGGENAVHGEGTPADLDSSKHRNSRKDSTQITQKELAEAGFEPSGTTLGSQPGAQWSYDETRQVLTDYTADFAREFGDQATLKSSTSRAYNLLKQSGLTLEAFIDHLYEARSITKERHAAIKGKKMGYFFSVLTDRLGLKDVST